MLTRPMSTWFCPCGCCPKNSESPGVGPKSLAATIEVCYTHDNDLDRGGFLCLVFEKIRKNLHRTRSAMAIPEAGTGLFLWDHCPLASSHQHRTTPVDTITCYNTAKSRDEEI